MCRTCNLLFPHFFFQEKRKTELKLNLDFLRPYSHPGTTRERCRWCWHLESEFGIDLPVPSLVATLMACLVWMVGLKSYIPMQALSLAATLALGVNRRLGAFWAHQTHRSPMHQILFHFMWIGKQNIYKFSVGVTSHCKINPDVSYSRAPVSAWSCIF